MTPTIRRRRLTILSSLLWTFSPACGSAPSLEKAVDASQQIAHEVLDSVRSAADNAEAYFNGDQLKERRSRCDQEKGTWVERIDIGPCEDGQVELTLDGATEIQACDSGTGGSAEFQCVHRDPSNLAYFNDGPSTPAPLEKATSLLSEDYDLQRWSGLFWPAAVNHDYCYHNGSTYGFDKTDCDQQLVSDVSAICAVPHFAEQLRWFDRETCHKNAAAAFAAVRACGDEFFEQLNSKVEYPAYSPLWQQYGLAADASDHDLLADIDKLLETYNPCGA